MPHSGYTIEYITSAHDSCRSHKDEIESSQLCGCFYCGKTFLPNEIAEWLDEPNGGQTAICPTCGIDSVLGDKYPVSDKLFLDEMNRFWFG